MKPPNLQRTDQSVHIVSKTVWGSMASFEDLRCSGWQSRERPVAGVDRPFCQDEVEQNPAACEHQLHVCTGVHDQLTRTYGVDFKYKTG